jgi:hypothetical protein
VLVSDCGISDISQFFFIVIVVVSYMFEFIFCNCATGNKGKIPSLSFKIRDNGV